MGPGHDEGTTVFSGILIDKGESGQTVTVAELDEAQLPDGDVTVDVEFSTLNFKDGLAITGKSPVVRKFPMVPGIDLAGVVTDSSHAAFSAGDRVVLNGWGVGETHWGGLAQKARLSGDWLIPLPSAFDSRQAMAIGTAGYTASLCVEALLKAGVTPEQGEILVTGATGGVGSVAIALLTKAGFSVAAATGKATETAYLENLGATTVIDRAELSGPGKPLQKERWRVRWTPSAATRWPTCARRPATAGRSRPADWPRAWTFRPRWRRSSCAGCRCWVSTA